MANRKQRRADESKARRAAKAANRPGATRSPTNISELGGWTARVERTAKEIEMLRAAKSSVDNQLDVNKLACDSVLVIIDLMSEDPATEILFAVGRNLSLDDARHTLDELRLEYKAIQFPYTYFSFWMNRNVARMIFEDLGMPFSDAWLRVLSLPATQKRILTCMKIGASITVANQDYSDIKPLDAPFTLGGGSRSSALNKISDQSRIAPTSPPTTSEAIPGTGKVRMVTPSEVYELHVRGRRTVYLDNNVWIRLTDGKTAAAVECLAACRLALANKVAIFPVSYASVSELLEQPPEAPRGCQSALMDELSQGVSFRSADSVAKMEVRSAFGYFMGDGYDPPKKSELFTYVIEQFADGWIVFPEGISAQAAQDFMSYFRAHDSMRSVSWLLAHLDVAALRARHAASGKNFVALLTDNIKRSAEHFRNGPHLDAKGMLREEHMALFRSTILPLFQELMLERWSPPEIRVELPRRLAVFSERNGKGSPEQLARLIAMMPALDLFSQMMKARSMEPMRQVHPQDFWDVEHARIPGAYADVFATGDRGLVDLLQSRCRIPRERNCMIVRRLEDLTALLKRWCEEPENEPIQAPN
jgi:hypothetical protein